jgi:hypothetical protein
VGPIYNGAQVEKPQFYKGQIHGLMRFRIFLYFHDTVPVAGQMYLFFAKGPPTGDGYSVLKMLPGTKDNVQATILVVLKERAAKKLQGIQQQQGH